MAISPPSDLVLDVLRAAGPDADNRLAATLRQKAVTGPDSSALAFADTMRGEALRVGGTGADLEIAPTSSADTKLVQTAHHESSQAGPYEKFEAFVLRSFVESMLPSENSSFFGEGTAGGIWRSMMAEQIGDELAKGGGIGIADMLEESRSADHLQSVSMTSDSTANDVADKLTMAEGEAAALTGLNKL
ncbi:rod-binding protein [Consotaella aegiceratis]|uniref:rod-binding protein n=1 Tax=Consotaella aegiceratis TaxID=3097961 RepID=UPI002F3E9804